jgi:predicted nucleotidyltransferase
MSDGQKKHQLLQILEKLSPVWPSGRGIMVLLEFLEYDPKYVEALLKIFQKAISSLKDSKIKKIMQQWIESLKKMQKQEAMEAQKDKLRAGDILTQELW